MAAQKRPTKTPARRTKSTTSQGKGKGKAKRQARPDSDTRTIAKILFGLVGMLVLVGGMIGAYDFFSNDTQKSDQAASQSTSGVAMALPTPPPSTQGLLTTEQNAQAGGRTGDYTGGDGPRSGFDPDQAYEPGEVVIANPQKGFENKIRAEGFRVAEHIRLPSLGLSLARVATPAGMSVPDAVRTLSRLLPGATIDANAHFEASAGTGGLDRTSANPRAVAGWADLSPNCGRGLTLGQIDSGVDVSHPALINSDLTYRAFPKAGRQPGPPDHGTAVAAMLVGSADWGGLLPGAKLYAVNMFEINEQGEKVGSAVGLLKGLDWLVSQKVDAINLSVAGSNNKIVTKAFKMAQRKNTALVAAVGNWGRADKPAYPAAFEHVVAVTATKGAELIYSHANMGDYVDFAAPGVGIYTALPGGGGKPQSGTSFATPYITAIAAVLAHAGKAPDADTLRTILAKVTRDLGRPGKDDVFGFGSLRARPVCQ